MFCWISQAWRAAVVGCVLVSLCSLSIAQPVVAPDAPLLTPRSSTHGGADCALSDSLIAQILMAATYPLEVVEADRWLRLPPTLR